jgi:hypothetical protein
MTLVVGVIAAIACACCAAVIVIALTPRSDYDDTEDL